MATTKKSTRLKEPVKVRTKKLADGSESYYLDIYVDGKRSYEFLKLYLLPEINPMVKEQNRATKAAVEAIKSKRIIELTHSKAGLKKTSVRSKMLLDDWMEAYLAEQERKGARGLKLLRTVCRLLPLYKKKVKMREIDKDWCLGFIDWIQHTYKTRWDKPLSPKSAADYVGYFSTALNAAVRAEVIPENPIMTLAATERIKVPESKREYLTIDEIKVLIDTECPREDVKRAYLFACYCGLRLSDVYALRWKDIVQDGEQYRMSTVMQKLPHRFTCLFPAMPSVGCLKGTVRKTGCMSLPDSRQNPISTRYWPNGWQRQESIKNHLSHEPPHVRHNDAYPRCGSLYHEQTARPCQRKDYADLRENR